MSIIYYIQEGDCPFLINTFLKSKGIGHQPVAGDGIFQEVNAGLLPVLARAILTFISL